jgi:SPP1 gp7 family putative phage head morphogenesis protein
VTTPQDVPEVIRVIDGFRADLMRGEARAATQLVRAYGPIYSRLATDIDVLLGQVESQQLTINQTLKLNRLQAIQRQIEAELATFSEFAQGTIGRAQADAVSLSQLRNQRVVSAALPPGLNLELLDSVGITWNQLPATAVESMVGFSGDGAPLANLLDPLGPEVRAGVTQELTDGIARGRSPRESARLIRNRFGMGLTRSLRISRTEQLRSYREATRLSYQQNSNIVKGYTRHASKDARTCMACLALDGKRYPLSVPLNEHVQGRCALVPDTIQYSDLGLNVPSPVTRRELGPDWFNRQTPGAQLDMMGPRRYKAWNSGEFNFTDQAKIVPNSTWGESAIVKPLKELI